ncbi:MAG: protoporphyrinogen oxidase [Gracilimonas sp.]
MTDIKAKNEILILGGGISGLATAWYLHKAGIPFKLFEKKSETGGSISSSVTNQSVMDFGPNSLRDQNGEIRNISDELGIQNDLIQISEAFKTRFIVRYGELQALEPGIGSLISTKILSGKGKLRILAEPFISKGKAEDESVGDFLERRIGKEAVDYLADPIFSGIYAGDIYQMSKYEILGKMAELEQEFGSLFWGMLRTKKEKKPEDAVEPMVLTFKKGIQQLTNAISDKLSDHIIHEEVTGLQRVVSGFKVETKDGSYDASRVISCIPAYSLPRILKGFGTYISEALNEIDYPPMVSTQLIYNREAISSQKTGFGFLVPRKENIRLLGAIWKTSLFPELSGADKVQFTLMTGGAHDRNVISDSMEKIEQEIISEFSTLMGISEKPGFVKSKLWEKAIPHLTVGYQKVRQSIIQAEEEYPGLFIGGNYRWGISVPDCVQGASKLVQKLKS